VKHFLVDVGLQFGYMIVSYKETHLNIRIRKLA